MSEQASVLEAKPPQPTSEFERRVSVRYQCSSEVSCSSLAPFERLSGRARDISMGGIALVLATSLRVGTDLVIELKTRTPGIGLTLMARVVHSTFEAEGTWIIGAKFLTTPTEEQIEALL
jgi:c-di-GMP-binding flagellar brake protein YcgR